MTRREEGSTAIARPLRQLFQGGTLAAADDGELIDRFVTRREEAAFEAIVLRHGPMVARVCGSILPNPDVADAYQATFLVLARRAGSIRPTTGSLAPWLFGVARRVAIQARAATVRRRAHEERAAAGRPEAVRDDNIVGLLLRSEILEEVHRLPSRLREPVILCYWQGLSYESAAEALGCPMRTVHSRLRTARERLRSRLERRGFGPTAGLAPLTLAPALSMPVPAVSLARLAVGLVFHATTAAIPPRVLLLLNGMSRTMTAPALMKAITLGGLALLLAVGGIGPKLTARLDDEPPPSPPPLLRPHPGRIAADAPPTLRPPAPLPWETAVRIKVRRPGGEPVGFASGTIIRSTPDEAIILTCAHTYEVASGQKQPPPQEFRDPIEVDLFDGQLHGPAERPYLHPTGSLVGELIDIDLAGDVGLVRIRPGRVLKTSPIVPDGWKPHEGQRMTTVGCDEGQNASPWSTRVTKSSYPVQITRRRDYDAIECEFAPKPGRSGGGLFTTDGLLAGVCNLADPKRDRGLYTGPAAIHRLLARNRLTALEPISENASQPTLEHRLAAALEQGPIRVGVSITLDSPADLERARPLLNPLSALGLPIRIDRVTPQTEPAAQTGDGK
jgi:RNA polymerase sigma factor (sigma-70 family)